MAIITKANQKFAYVIDQLGEEYTKEEFCNTFIDLYYTDWKKIVRRYEEHERKNKGKKHPMPSPRKYLWSVSYKARNGEYGGN